MLLALALEPQPELLLLDEPAAGIDFQDEEKFYDLIADLNRETGVTILLVSHDLSVVESHGPSRPVPGGRPHPATAHRTPSSRTKPCTASLATASSCWSTTTTIPPPRTLPGANKEESPQSHSGAGRAVTLW